MSERQPPLPPYRYTAERANAVELQWQERWEREGTFLAPNPSGDLAVPHAERAAQPPFYVLDMFPYPSGAGLHVGHPLGYIATDVYARFMRMVGFNVLHTMGFDSFGLPAERYASETGRHPAETTAENVATMRRQLRRLGLGHDPRRSVSTTDPEFFKWTQWIFLQIHNAYYDEQANAARPIGELIAAYEQGGRTAPEGAWRDLDEVTRQMVLDRHRLAYLSEEMVNWCPELGTVLANEEVTKDGRSELGGFPVVRRPLRQWMMRITAYADRLIDDLALLDWPEPLKRMQENWIGRSPGADVRFAVVGEDVDLMVFTTRPDTLEAVTFLALAPEHGLLDRAPEATAVAEYRAAAARRSERDRQADDDPHGIFTGLWAEHPLTGEQVPVYAADYVLASYGAGAVMGVPAHDDRDFRFAQAHGIEVRAAVVPPREWLAADGLGADAPASTWVRAFTDNDDDTATRGITVLDQVVAGGRGVPTIAYKLRDWLFSRQRYWGEPFPIVFDEDGMGYALPKSELPVLLPELDDFAPPTVEDPNAAPQPPLSRAVDWTSVQLDLGDGLRDYRRETNTMPQWAGSCWYYLRYLDPTNDDKMVDPEIERYWLGGRGAGGVDLYVGGTEHAVLHLLYARFWHKVLFDLGHVTTPEPFQRLINQGYVLAAAYQDQRKFYVDARKVVERPDGTFLYEGQLVQRSYGKMGKSLKNGVSPDEIYASHGADALRLYELFLGPVEQDRPWNTEGIAGVTRFLQRAWRLIVDEETGVCRVTEKPSSLKRLAMVHRTIASVGSDLEQLRFNTAIAALMELTRELQRTDAATVGRDVAEPLVLMLAPLAPHIAEELWSILGHRHSLAHVAFPQADEAFLHKDRVQIAVQVDGRLRGTVLVDAGAPDDVVVAAAEGLERVATQLRTRRRLRVVVVPERLVNFVTAA